MAALDLKDKRFGRLLVVERAPRLPGARNAMWRCLCDCGNETVAAAANIGKTTFSCGCLVKETSAATLRGNTYTRTHNMAGKPEYQAWTRMKLRCHDKNHPKFRLYGGRGIIVCDHWRHSFENFFADMGPRPQGCYSIDRENNDGNYEPGNCRWADHETQQNNTRRNVYYEYLGMRMTLRQALKASGSAISFTTAAARISRHGWSLEDAIRKPVRLNSRWH